MKTTRRSKAHQKAGARTQAIHAGEPKRHGVNVGVGTSICRSSTFTFSSTHEMKEWAEGKNQAYIYTRYGNPTLTVAEEKIAALEGADAAVVTSRRNGRHFLCAAWSFAARGRSDFDGATLRRHLSVDARSFSRHGHHGPPGGDFARRNRDSRHTAHKSLVRRDADKSDAASGEPEKRDCVRQKTQSRRHRRQYLCHSDAETSRARHDMVVQRNEIYLGGHSDIIAGAAVAVTSGWIACATW